jgi:hypothetical protein
VYLLNLDSHSNVVVHDALQSPALALFDTFGQSCSMDRTGTLFAIGIPGFDNITLDPNSIDRGAVQTYFRSLDGSELGHIELGPLLLYPKTQNRCQFGLALSISPDGNWLAVGAACALNESFIGDAFIYASTLGTWSLVQVLTDSTLPAASVFGYGFSFSNDSRHLLISSSGVSQNAYRYELNATSQLWGLAEKIISHPDYLDDTGSQFGYAMAFAPDFTYLLISSPLSSFSDQTIPVTIDPSYVSRGEVGFLLFFLWNGPTLFLAECATE